MMNWLPLVLNSIVILGVMFSVGEAAAQEPIVVPSPTVIQGNSSQTEQGTLPPPKLVQPTNESVLKRLEEAEAKIKKLEAAKPTDKKEEKKPEEICTSQTILPNCLYDSLSGDECYGMKSLFDSFNPQGVKGKNWFEKYTIRGYSQFRFTRTLELDDDSANPNILGDRSVNGNAENFSIRRMRLIFFGDVSDFLSFYLQPDFANTPPGSTGPTFFAQLRDVYGDVYIDKEREHRFRVGLSKVPYGWENLQSSQNRIPLDRSDAINTAVSPNERDLGVFYYWTPKEKQDLFRDLVAGGLKGSGNYGIFGLGVYDGQGGSIAEANLNLHTVARVTYPFQLSNGQVVEASVQAFTGDVVVSGAAIRPLGVGGAITPAGTGGSDGIRDQRIAGTFVWYPQPLGFQAEWNVGEGPGLNDSQTAVVLRDLQGGYVQTMYKYDSQCYGIFIPFVRWQYYHGGYRSQPNAPYGTTEAVQIGVEWQIRKEMELVCEYSVWDGVTLNANNQPGVTSYRNYEGNFLRLQFQVNY